MFREYEEYDATGLAELVNKGDVSEKELFDTAIEKIDKHNHSLNAVITPMFDEAKKRMGEGLPDGPFKGVPFLLKDLLSAYKGVRLSSGCRAYKDYVPDFDSELVKRFKASGVNILGKTNTPELGLMGVTEPELFGPTRNPWDTGRTPGGSSGGSAAAVAARIVPFASGGDGGGSIRIPSSYCGLFGLKPTRFRTPTGPVFGRIWQGAAVEHVLTRSVRDSAAMLDATRGPDVGAPFVTPPPERPYLEELGRPAGELKVAYSVESPLGTEVHEDCVKAVHDTAKLLEGLGHKVEEAKPDVDGIALADSYFNLYYGEVAADIAAVEADTGRKPRRSDFEISTWLLGQLGKRKTAQDFVEAIRLWDTSARELGRFFERYDVYLTPTAAWPQPMVGEVPPKGAEKAAIKFFSMTGLVGLLEKTGMIRQQSMAMLAKVPFTQIANFTGVPAMSMPLAEHADGMPCGVQFVAPFGEEGLLFRLASQLEEARPWVDRRPPLD